MKKHKKLIIILIIISLLLLTVFGIGFMYYKTKKETMTKLSKLYFSGLNEKQEVGKTINDVKYNLNCSHVVKYPKTGDKKIDGYIKNEVLKLEKKFQKEHGENIDMAGMEQLGYYQYIDYESYLGVDNTLSIIFNETEEVNESNVLSEKVYTYNFSITSGELLKSSYIFVGDYKSKISAYLEKYLTTTPKIKDFVDENYKDTLKKIDYKYALTNEGLNIYFDKYEIASGNMGTIKVSIPYTELNTVMNINTSLKTEKLKPNTGVKVSKTKYTKSDKAMYVKSLVNFYKKDDKNSKLLGTIVKGEKVKVLEIGDTGFTKVNYNNKDGYVSSNFLSDTVVTVEGYAAVNETVYAINSVNVRQEDNTKCAILGKLSRGDNITRVGKSDNGWSEVVYNNDKAYIYSSYLSTTKPTENSAIIDVDPQRGIDPNKPMVALTFDDGPNPISTPRILNTLAKYNTVGTFFDLGTLIYTYPKVVKQEAAAGNEVGSHTYDHANLNRLSVDGINSEMAKSEQAFMSVLGHKPTLVRPPYGSANDTVKQTIKYPLINWDIDTLDWKSRNKDAILSEFRKTSNYDGKIILMHSIYGTTADAVEVMVPELISKGYQLVTVSELAKYKGVSLESGRIYYSF